MHRLQACWFPTACHRRLTTNLLRCTILAYTPNTSSCFLVQQPPDCLWQFTLDTLHEGVSAPSREPTRHKVKYSFSSKSWRLPLSVNQQVKDQPPVASHCCGYDYELIVLTRQAVGVCVEDNYCFCDIFLMCFFGRMVSEVQPWGWRCQGSIRVPGLIFCHLKLVIIKCNNSLIYGMKSQSS